MKGNRKLIWRSIVIVALFILLYISIKAQQQLQIILVSVLLLINIGYLIFMLRGRKKIENQQ